MARLRSTAFGILLAVVLLAHVIVLWVSIVRNTLWEDEAFNLTVPLNLLRGLGYTSDGLLSGSLPTPFDVRISTGPVVLLPIAAVLSTGVDPVVGGRLVPAAFSVALLVAVWMLGRRIGGRWAALVALAVPLAFDATRLPSPIQGPADVLGEVAAAALLAWALVALQRHPWLAGLLVGLAVQSKYIALLAAPAFAVGLLLTWGGKPWRRRIVEAVTAVGGVLLPSVLYALWVKLASPPGGLTGLWFATRDFVETGGQQGYHSTFGEKLAVLAESWRLPVPLVVAVVLVGAAALIAAGVLLARDPRLRRNATGDDGRAAFAPLAVAALGVALYVVWWAQASHTPLWVRHPAPGLLAFTPVLAAYVVAALRVLAARARAVAAVGGAVVAGVIGAQAVVAVVAAASVSPADLDAVRAVAADIAALDQERIATDWGRSVSPVVLSGAHGALADAPPENIEGLLRLVAGEECPASTTLVTTTVGHVICAPAP
ncbi:glycosyltransferase family 39 protein [Microbacterium sp. No. 7]|uniref:glycosyltransferase family 39 protein n=1 Tax=Microbacterium sp. No. 7 TaxID=1714373 RepID=UPI0006D0E0AB|nr:glycosyltransferase family 39 protein [Microbacterium sp. No. 7]ALJ19109.1 hypothetical protein AOA12_04000 [Microbacterium sp. No. 7]